MTPRIRVSLGCALAMILPLAAGAQRGPVTPPLVASGQTRQLGPHSYLIADNNVGQVPNVGIVVGTRATLVIDPGLGRRNGETVWREVQRISRNTELWLASTHYHVEHTGGLAAFPADARYANSKVQEQDYTEGAAAQAKNFSNMSPAHAELLQGMTRRTADVLFEREHTFDLGGVRVRAVMVGPTHTRGDTIFFVEGDQVLYAGDVVMNRSFLAATPVTSMKAWLAAFDLLEPLMPKVIVPAHGPVGDGSLVGVNRALMHAIQARVRQLKGQGLTRDDIATTVQMEMQARHPGFARVNGVAAAARAAYTEAP